ncbi:MAG: hypothetical protein QOJ81_493 [Chloroflexota bacterium]|nr:hypothetical protein [Chloroflexota bacterium]
MLTRPARSVVLPALAVALPALALYCLTLMPDVGFWDTAEFQTVGPVLGIAHPTGFPAYTLLAWLASVVFTPLGNDALRANLLSAVLGAGAVALITATVALLTRRWAIAVGVGAAVALSSEVWRISLHADPHALHLFLVALLLLVLAVWSERVSEDFGQGADRWLIAGAIVFGVALGNHGLTFLLAPGIALMLLVSAPSLLRRPRLVFTCALALAATTVALYLYLPIRSAMDPPLDYANPQTWDGFRFLVFAEQFRGSFHYPPDPLAAISLAAGKSLAELGPIAVLALLGLVSAWSRRAGLVVLLLGWLIVGWLFALVYVNADIGRYYIVPLVSVAVLGGLGADAVWDTLRPMLTGPRLRSVIAVTAVVLLLTPIAFVPLGRYAQVDESRDLSGRAWLEAMVEHLPANALVISWWSYSTTLWYGQFAEGLRPDVTVIDDSTREQQGLGSAFQVINDNLGRRPVYLIRLGSDLPNYANRYALTIVPDIPGEPVYRVDGVRQSAQVQIGPVAEPIIPVWP